MATTTVPQTRARSSMVSRVVTILRAYDGRGDDLPLSELAARSGLPKSTLHRIVNQLVDEGVLDRTDNGYRLGLALFELGGLVPGPRRLREAAIPFIEALHEATKETIHFGVLDGVEVLYLERIFGHTSVTAPTRTGGRMPAYCTGLGKAMLAFSPPSVVDEVVKRGLQGITPGTIVVPSVLRDDLQSISQEGVAYDREERLPGVACVAAPVLDRQGMAIAAISVTSRPAQVASGRLTPAVKATAAALSRAVQARPDRYWCRSELAGEFH